MAKLLEFQGEYGDVVIAVREPQDAVAPVGVEDTVREKMKDSLASVLRMVSSVAKDFQASLAGAPVESAEIEFGVELTGKGKAYVLEAGAGATLTVRLRVTPSPPS